MRTRNVAPIALALTLAFAAAGCGGSSKPASPSPSSTTVAQGALAGHTYVSTSVTGHTMPAGTKVTLTFGADGTLGADAGCNHLGGAFHLDGDHLVVEQMSQTAMGCIPAARQDQDAWIAGVLGGRPTVVVQGTTLRLSAGATTIDLTES